MIAWTRCAWQASMAEHGGAIVNIASVGGLIVDPHIGYYNATKAAMLHLTRQLAYELGPKARVNAIAPGLIKTELARAVWEVREPILTAKLPPTGGRPRRPRTVRSATRSCPRSGWRPTRGPARTPRWRRWRASGR
jgi:NAD(P)-dependent dehydrogenase (short-subunit alcohol dehydrogenase family)